MEILNVLTRGARGTIRVNRHRQKKTCNRIKKKKRERTIYYGWGAAATLLYGVARSRISSPDGTVPPPPPPGFLPFPELTGGVRRMNHKKTNVNIMQAQTWMASQDPLKKAWVAQETGSLLKRRERRKEAATECEWRPNPLPSPPPAGPPSHPLRPRRAIMTASTHAATCRQFRT